jgi:glyoxylase-like metal-dependent hydrolase (beta-lactamase superfamily II)
MSTHGSAPEGLHKGPVDHVVTHGTFSLDGGTWEVDNNVWVVGDENEVVVIDAAHDPEAIGAIIAGRRVVAVVCTHAHDDHVNQAPRLADTFNAPILLNPAEAPLWEMTHPNRAPDQELTDGQVITAGGIELRALVTPGHSPGSTCLYAPELSIVFTGDTLFNGGPGATGRSFSDRPTIEHSIRSELFTLHGDTVVRTGHGDDTTIAAELSNLG